jgi:hypothetical protein
MHGIYRHLTVMLLRTTHLLPSANRRDGDTVLTQYFERAVFEHHPDNQAPYQVLLRRLGVEELQARGWCAAAPLAAVTPTPHRPAPPAIPRHGYGSRQGCSAPIASISLVRHAAAVSGRGTGLAWLRTVTHARR